MEGYEKLNEMITLLQRIQDSKKYELGKAPDEVSSRDVLNFVNEDPRGLQEQLDFAKTLEDDFVGQNITPNFVSDLAAE